MRWCLTRCWRHWGGPGSPALRAACRRNNYGGAGAGREDVDGDDQDLLQGRWGRDALELWEKMKKMNWPMDFILYSTMLTMCEDLGLEEDAEKLFDEMWGCPSRRLSDNLIPPLLQNLFLRKLPTHLSPPYFASSVLLSSVASGSSSPLLNSLPPTYTSPSPMLLLPCCYRFCSIGIGEEARDVVVRDREKLYAILFGIKFEALWDL